VDDDQFDHECGVGQFVHVHVCSCDPNAFFHHHPFGRNPRTHLTGFSITPEALSYAVSEYVNSSAVTGWANMGAAITALRNTPALRWANPLEIKNAVEAALAARFGAKEVAKPKSKVRAVPPSCLLGDPVND